jgi:hypothetical protein
MVLRDKAGTISSGANGNSFRVKPSARIVAADGWPHVGHEQKLLFCRHAPPQQTMCDAMDVHPEHPPLSQAFLRPDQQFGTPSNFSSSPPSRLPLSECFLPCASQTHYSFLASNPAVVY